MLSAVCTQRNSDSSVWTISSQCVSSAEIQKNTPTTNSDPSMKLHNNTRKQLQETLEPLKKKLQCCERVKVEFNQTAKHIKVQAGRTETQIKEQFKKASSVSGGGRGGQDGCTEGGRGAEESDDEGED